MKQTYRNYSLAGTIVMSCVVLGIAVFVPCAGAEDFTRTVKVPIGLRQGASAPPSEELAPESVVARVNGVPILGADLNRAVQSLKNMLMESGQVPDINMLPENYLRKEAVDTLIANELLFQESQKMKFDMSDEELDAQIKSIKEQTPPEVYRKRVASADEGVFRNAVKKNILIHRVIESKMDLTKDSVDEEQVKKYYEENKKSMKRSSASLRMSHIFAAVPPDSDEELIAQKRRKIEDAKKKLDEGASWNDVVAEFSEDTERGNDGDIGYYSVKMFENDILEGTVPEKIDEVSGVIRSKSGFHIIKITDRKPKGGYLTYEEARPTLENMAFRDKYQDKILEIVTQLKKESKIDVYVDVQNDWKN